MQHRAIQRDYPDEIQIYCMDCNYLRVMAKRLDGRVIEPGRVVRRGVSAAHRLGDEDAGLEAVRA